MITLVIACMVSASLGCAFGFLIGAIIRGGSGGHDPITPPAARMDITLHGLDRSSIYNRENIERFLQEIERRSAEGRVLKIQVA